MKVRRCVQVDASLKLVNVRSERKKKTFYGEREQRNQFTFDNGVAVASWHNWAQFFKGIQVERYSVVASTAGTVANIPLHFAWKRQSHDDIKPQRTMKLISINASIKFLLRRRWIALHSIPWRSCVRQHYVICIILIFFGKITDLFSFIGEFRQVCAFQCLREA